MAHFLIECIKLPRKTPIKQEQFIFNKKELEAYSINMLITTNSVRRAIREHSCREFLKSTVNNIHSFAYSNTKEYNVMMGIKLTGENYHAVAEVLEKAPDKIKKVSAMFSNLLGINFSLVSGFDNIDDDSEFHRGGTRIMLYTEQLETYYIPNNGYVTVFVDFDDNSMEFNNMGVRISALLALLRERFIIDGIVNNKIKSLKEIINSLLELTVLRYDKKDSFMTLYQSISGMDYRNETIRNEMFRNILGNPTNDGGTDWYSLFCLCIFLHMTRIKDPILLEVIDGDGPVTVVLSTVGRIDIPLFLKSYSTEELTKRMIEYRESKHSSSKLLARL